MRREIPLLITGFVGLFMILSFFTPHPWIFDTAETLQSWFIVIAAFAVVLGVGNLIRVNLHRIRRRGEDWGYKIVTLVALVGFVITGLVLNVQLEIRANWITRALGIYEPPPKELLDGRLRLPDRRDEVAAAIEAAGDRAQARAAVEALGFGPDVTTPDLVDLGPVGVKALDARETLAALREEWQSDEPWKREVMRLTGRLQTTGLAPLVADILATDSDDRHRELMTLFSFTRDQADDLLTLSPDEVLAARRPDIQAEMERLDEEQARLVQMEGEIIRNPADWVFRYVYTPLQATMFSLLAFFIASAAFRAFRMRSVEAVFLLSSGVLVILGRVPLGQFAWWGKGGESEFGFHIIMNWIMNIPNSAAMRGILMGAAMGVIVMGLKVILGIERSYLGGD